MGIISHITKLHCKSTCIVVLLTIPVQHDNWKRNTERTLRVPDGCYRAVFFTLDRVSPSCFTAVASHHFVVTRRCRCLLQSVRVWCHAVKALVVILGILAGGSLVSELSLVASRTLQGEATWRWTEISRNELSKDPNATTNACICNCLYPHLNALIILTLMTLNPTSVWISAPLPECQPDSFLKALLIEISSPSKAHENFEVQCNAWPLSKLHSY